MFVKLGEWVTPVVTWVKGVTDNYKVKGRITGSLFTVIHNVLFMFISPRLSFAFILTSPVMKTIFYSTLLFKYFCISHS